MAKSRTFPVPKKSNTSSHRTKEKLRPEWISAVTFHPSEKEIDLSKMSVEEKMRILADNAVDFKASFEGFHKTDMIDLENHEVVQAMVEFLESKGIKAVLRIWPPTMHEHLLMDIPVDGGETVYNILQSGVHFSPLIQK